MSYYSAKESTNIYKVLAKINYLLQCLKSQFFDFFYVSSQFFKYFYVKC